MSTVLSVDPGLRGCGVALFLDGVLTAADYVKCGDKELTDLKAVCAMAASVAQWSIEKTGGPLKVDTLVLELPQVYTASKSKGDPNDLIMLAAVDGALAMWFNAEIVTLRPKSWKGTMPKDTCIARVKGRLSPQETTVVVNRGVKTHNTWDACGIGLFYLGRFERKRVFSAS